MGTLNGLRAAVYARFSSDKQSDASIEDQVHRAREWLRAQGGDPDAAQVYSDYAVSGASMDRPGMRSLEHAINAKAVDVVITESVDRISRDVEDAARFRKMLAHRGVELACLDGTRLGTTGKSDALTFGMRALFAEQFRLDLADKTRRGLEGRARKGAPTGAVAYGFRIVTSADGSKRIEVDNERAAIVRRIFASYASGMSLASVASELNGDGIPPPRAHSRRVGTGWMDTAIRSMLLNERYIGKWTFGEREWVKVPGTNRRVPRRRASGPLLSSERPELALVDDRTWSVVQGRFADRSGIARTAVVNYPLSGVLVCGVCGGLMTCVGGKVRRYGCVISRKRGTCKNRKSLRIEAAETAFFSTTTEVLRARVPKVAAHAKRLLAEWSQSRGHRGAELKRRAKDVETQTANIAAAIATTGPLSALVQQLAILEEERKAVRAELAQLEQADPVLPTPEEIAHQVTSLDRLRSADPDVVRMFARTHLEGGRIVCTPLDGIYRLEWSVSAWAVLNGKNPGEFDASPGVYRNGCGSLVYGQRTHLYVPCFAEVA